jgi:hypothetical protein
MEIPRDVSEATLSMRIQASRPVVVERQIRYAPGKGVAGSRGIRL